MLFKREYVRLDLSRWIFGAEVSYYLRVRLRHESVRLPPLLHLTSLRFYCCRQIVKASDTLLGYN